MHVLIVRFELHVPHSRSLKEKRAAIRPVVEGIRNRFSLSVAEVAHQDKWQRAAIGGAIVSASQSHAREVVEAVERYVWSKPDTEVADFQSRWFDWEGPERPYRAGDTGPERPYRAGDGADG